MNTYEFDTTPLDEPCSQVGSDNYSRDSVLECRVLQRQLIREFGEPPGGAHFYRKSNSHDFGTYHELCLKFDEDNEAHMEYFLKVDRNFPQEWDNDSLQELKEGDYSLFEKLR